MPAPTLDSWQLPDGHGWPQLPAAKRTGAPEKISSRILRCNGWPRSQISLVGSSSFGGTRTKPKLLETTSGVPSCRRCSSTALNIASALLDRGTRNG